MLELLEQQKRLLEIQLNAINVQIAVQEDEPLKVSRPETSIAVQGNTDQAIPTANGSGIESTNLLKDDALLKSMQSPDPLNGKTSKLVNVTNATAATTSSPAANGSGKDGSNPLIPVALGKSKQATNNGKQATNNGKLATNNGKQKVLKHDQ